MSSKIPKVKTRKWSDMTVGASSKERLRERIRVLDGYHTPRIAVEELLRREKFHKRVWEPANGFHRISRVLEEQGYLVYTSDIKQWCSRTKRQRAFEKWDRLPGGKRHDIITNPPFKHAQMFVEHSMRLLPEGGKLALLLRLQFLEGRKRRLMFKRYPPRYVYVFSYRLPRMHIFRYRGKNGGSTLAFAWFVWHKGYKGRPEIVWV